MKGLNDMKNVCCNSNCRQGRDCPLRKKDETFSGNKILDVALVIAGTVGIAWLLVQGV